MNENQPETASPAPEPRPGHRFLGIRRAIAPALLAAGLLAVGGVAAVNAASPAPTTTPAPAATSSPSTGSGGSTTPNHTCPNR